MAWTSTSKDICSTPFLMRELTVTPDSTTATEVAHGGPTGTTPDLVLITSTQSNPTATEVTNTTNDGTNCTFDVEGTAARFKAYVFWFAQARQDSQSIDTDNDG